MIRRFFFLSVGIGIGFLVANVANAEITSYSRTPSNDILDIDTPVELYFEYNDVGVLPTTNGRVVEYFVDGSFYGCTYQPYDNQPTGSFVENFTWPVVDQLTWKITLGTNIDCGPFTIPPNTIQGDSIDYTYDVPDSLEVIEGGDPNPTGNLWGNSNGFWGETTPETMVATLEQGTGETFNQISPLFLYVGIPITFAIAFYLLYLINQTLTPQKTPINDSMGLEPKKRRGRPRKTPVE